MPIVIVEMMKLINERENFNTKCVIMRWSNNEM